MQIFCPSHDPAYSAASLDDARVIKMATETAQLLSAAARHLRGMSKSDPETLMGLSLYKRPTSGHSLWQWAAEHDGNWDWLVCHGKAIVDELDFRGLCPGKLVAPRALLEMFYQPFVKQAVFAGHSGLKRHQQARGFVNRACNERDGLDFRGVADVHEAYRQYLAARWASEPNARWSKRGQPGWLLPITKEAS